jgi:2-oxoglutarate ferredoxin oxidoreductase subunit delta
MASKPVEKRTEEDVARPSAKVIILAEFCKGCRLCLDVCPRNALKLSGTLTETGVEIIAWDEKAGCSACLMCATICPDAAITIIPDDEDERESND